MNHDTNRPVQREQEMIPNPVRMDEHGNEGPRRKYEYREGEPYVPFPSRNEQYKRAWYNQGWFWLIVAVCFIGLLTAGLLMLSKEVSGISSAVREQTEMLREQNGLLASIGHRLSRLSAAADRIAQAIRDAVNQLLASL